MVNKVIVPDIGDFENVEIIEILVKSGDKIKKNDCHRIVVLICVRIFRPGVLNICFLAATNFKQKKYGGCIV